MARSTYALLPAAATVIGAVVLRRLPSLAELAGVGLVALSAALHREIQPPPAEEKATLSQEGKTKCDT
jgi:inner membrane transporter RhtA